MCDISREQFHQAIQQRGSDITWLWIASADWNGTSWLSWYEKPLCNLWIMSCVILACVALVWFVHVFGAVWAFCLFRLFLRVCPIMLRIWCEGVAFSGWARRNAGTWESCSRRHPQKILREIALKGITFSEKLVLLGGGLGRARL